MKNLSQLLIILFLLPTFGFAQEEDTPSEDDKRSREIVKSRKFGENLTWYKFDDGSRNWEYISKNNEESVVKIKKSNTDTGLNFDFGINTWLGDESAPAIRPWGSWTPAINYFVKYKFSKNFHLKPMLGINWYNLKFEDHDLQAIRTPDGIAFETFADGSGIKSKISASYANISLIPTFQSSNGNFRFGIGPYAGIRLGGRGKIAYLDENGSRRKAIDNANMFANDFRYGGRLELGIGSVDLFANYDLNEMFQTNKGPQVNTLSFGIIL